MTDAAFLGVSTAWIIANVWSVAVALLVLVGGWFASGFLSRHIASLLPRPLGADGTIVPLLSQVVRYAVLLVTIIIVLGQFGVQTASILAVLGAAGLAVALALQGTLSNIAAGILLVFLRPFSVGDNIDADGIAGTVVEIGLFGTQFRTQEGIFMFAPNSKLSNARIINYSREPSRVVDIKFNVPRTADIDHVRQAVAAGLATDLAIGNQEPEVQVETLSDTTITLAVRVPVASGGWTSARSLLQERLKRVLDVNNGFAPLA
jgi:small conductance mechanosensitive channel